MSAFWVLPSAFGVLAMLLSILTIEKKNAAPSLALIAIGLFIYAALLMGSPA